MQSSHCNVLQKAGELHAHNSVTIGCRHNDDLATRRPVSFLTHPDHMLELGLPIEFAVSFPFSAANWFKRAAFSNLHSYENQLRSKSGVFRQRIGCIRMVQLLLHQLTSLDRQRAESIKFKC